jgi:hypothetical protein
MASVNDRPGTAVLVIDVQNGVVAKAHEREAVVGSIVQGPFLSRDGMVLARDGCFEHALRSWVIEPGWAAVASAGGRMN